MIERFDQSCMERCRERPLLQQTMTEREEALDHPGSEVFEGEISCSGICTQLPGGSDRCNAVVTQPLALERRPLERA